VFTAGRISIAEMSDFFMEDNERWIEEVMDQNCKILDGG
jgi:hypothetical protein